MRKEVLINIKDTNNVYQTNIGKYFINNLSNNIEELINSIKTKFDMTNKTFSISNAKGFTSSTVAFCMNNASNNNLRHTGKMYKKNYNNLYICK